MVGRMRVKKQEVVMRNAAFRALNSAATTPRSTPSRSRTTGPSKYPNWFIGLEGTCTVCSMLDIREIQAIQREVRFFRSRTRTLTDNLHPFHWSTPNQLNGITKIVNGITQRFQQRLDQAASTAHTLDALQDRIVQLEKEIDKLKFDNNALKDKVVADAEASKKKHNVQRQQIEQITEERDGALQRLEKLEVTLRGCFPENRPAVSRHIRNVFEPK